MRLYDWATVMRSKNAGPFTLTIDLIFDDRTAFERVLTSEAFSETTIARLYGVSVETVGIHPFERVLAIKVSLPRSWSSAGGPNDRDVYGSCQHFPLGDLEI